jgi:hypothetical protein
MAKPRDSVGFQREKRMTYEELKSAAKTHKKNWNTLHNQMIDALVTVIGTFEQRCKIPKGKLSVSRWNGEPPMNDERTYDNLSSGPVADAAVFDKADGMWRIGVRVILSEDNVIPPTAAFFTLAVTQQDGKTILFRPPDGHREEIDIDNTLQMEKIADLIAEAVVTRFKEPPLSYLKTKSRGKEVGFHVSIDQPDIQVVVDL